MTKPVVGMWYPPAKSHEVGHHLTANYAAAFERLGFECLFAPAEGESNLSGQRRLMRSRARLLFNHGGWLMSRSWRRIFGRQIGEELNRSGKPVLTLVADEPFQDWLVPIFSRMPRRGAVFSIDPTFTHGIGHWVPSGCHAPYLPCGHMLDGHGPVATGDKTIDLLFIGTITDPETVRVEARAKPKVQPLFDALVDRGLHNYATPVAMLASELRPGPRGFVDMDDPDMQETLRYANLFIRSYRRWQLLTRLAHHPATIVTSRPVTLPGAHPDLKALPPCSFLDMLKLTRQSRATVILQPPFPGAVNERIMFSMQARCLVIATPNPRTGQLFTHGEELLFAHGDSNELDAMIDLARDTKVADAIRDRALEVMQARHTPDGNIRYMLGVMAAHGLLDPDLPIPPGSTLDVPPDPAWTG